MPPPGNSSGCPPEVVAALLGILSDSLLAIRSSASDAAFCFAESDHVHNLPGLIQRFSRERLEYYMQAERAGYLGKLDQLGRGHEWAGLYRPRWAILQRYLDEAE